MLLRVRSCAIPPIPDRLSATRRMEEAMAAQAASKSAAVLHSEAKIRVRPLSGFIGAEIEGVDLAQAALVRAVQGRARRLRELRGDRAARPGHHGRPADGVRRAVRRALDPSLLAQPRRQARGHHPRLFQGQSAGADRHLACRRDLSRGTADGDHPARQGRAGGRRRHAVRQHERRLSRPERAHEAAHPRPRVAARLQAVAAAVRPQATARGCASSRTSSPIPGIRWCACIR